MKSALITAGETLGGRRPSQEAKASEWREGAAAPQALLSMRPRHYSIRLPCAPSRKQGRQVRAALTKRGGISSGLRMGGNNRRMAELIAIKAVEWHRAAKSNDGRYRRALWREPSVAGLIMASVALS